MSSENSTYVLIILIVFLMISVVLNIEFESERDEARSQLKQYEGIMIEKVFLKSLEIDTSVDKDLLKDKVVVFGVVFK